MDRRTVDRQTSVDGRSNGWRMDVRLTDGRKVDGQTVDGQLGVQTDRLTDWRTDGPKNGLAGWRTDRLSVRCGRTDGRPDRQMDRQTKR